MKLEQNQYAIEINDKKTTLYGAILSLRLILHFSLSLCATSHFEWCNAWACGFLTIVFLHSIINFFHKIKISNCSIHFILIKKSNNFDFKSTREERIDFIQENMKSNKYFIDLQFTAMCDDLAKLLNFYVLCKEILSIEFNN